jgi:plasmid replication initiation protein
MKKPKRGELVVKTNAMVRASYRLSLFEQKMVLFAIARAREEERGLFADQPLLIQAADFAEFWGMERDQTYQLLKDGLRTLFKRELMVFEPDRVTHSRWISQASYMEKQGAVSLIFAPEIIRHISRVNGALSSYTKYQLENIGKLTSAHAVRIYEMMSEFADLGSRKVTLMQFRVSLDLMHEYPSIKDFKKWVIDVAVAQINEHTDLQISYEQIKKGRVVDGFNFQIKRKPSKIKKLEKELKPVAKGGSDSRARPGESQADFEARLRNGELDLS